MKTVGEFEVSSRGIERIIEVGDCGTYSTELVIPKETFIDAFTEYILKPCKEAKGAKA